MLRGVVGTEAFWRGIRAYDQEHRDGNATTTDFRRAMEAASGMDLEQFFLQWLYRPGALQLEGDWTYDASARVVEVALRQVQDDGSRFEMPVEVGIEFEDGDRQIGRLQVKNDPGSLFSLAIPVHREPARVVLDPNTWVLMEANFVRRK